MTTIAPIPGAPKRSFGRRRFLVASAAGVGGLVLNFALPDSPARKAGVFEATAALAATGPSQLNAYLIVDTDNSVTLLFGGCEFGQGTMTGFASVVAEELHADWSQMRVLRSDASLDPLTGKANSYPVFRDANGNAVNIMYTTGGSGATKGRFATLRTAGATAREMLLTAAMGAFGVADRNRLTAVGGKVLLDGGADSRTFGQLAADAAKVPVPTVTLTDQKTAIFSVIGTTKPRFDIPLKTDGSAIFGIDVRLPGMLYGVVRHAPALGAYLAKTPAKPSGAQYLFPLKAEVTRGAVAKGSLNAVAVLATNTWAAMRAAKAVKATWTTPAASIQADSATILTQAQALLKTGTGLAAESIGTPSTIFDDPSAKRVDATYYAPYVPHVTMEVMNCTVKFTGSMCEMWVPTQAANACVTTAKGLTGLAGDRIIVHTTYLGGGLGRKIEQDYVSQAIQAAMQLYAAGGSGVVKLTWPREEDFANDQYRPMSLVRVRLGVNGSGQVALSYRAVTPSIRQQRQADPSVPLAAADSSAVEGATASRYGFASRLVEHVVHPAGVPIGYWRSVGYSINSFVLESAIDELAALAGPDPLAFRQALLKDNPRALAVVNAAAAASPWRTSLPANHAWGMAFAESFGSLVCQVVDVSAPTAGALRVHRVACAVDCGIGVNPGQIEAQMQGGIAHGLSAALWGQQTFVKGQPQVKNFNAYRMLSAREMPVVTVAIVNSGEALGGIGEPGVPPIGPAVANAYFRLTGTRIRSLPFFPNAGGFGDG